MEEQLIDYIHTICVYAGGVTALRRITDFASVYNVRTPATGRWTCRRSALVPISTSTSGSRISAQEYSGYLPEILDWMPTKTSGRCKQITAELAIYGC
jgi:mannonate dehydratase